MKVESTSKIIVLALSACSTMLIVAWLLRFCAYGFDFTDEGFYLAWISNPFPYEYTYPITHFGFIYHPIFLLLNEDITALRQFNVIVTFVLAWVLTYRQFKLCAFGVDGHTAVFYVISAGFAVSAFLVFTAWGWLPTPGYNSLVLQALLLTAIGLSLADKYDNSKSLVGWIVIGIGGWLTFMAKPSSALALAVGVLIYLFAARKFSIRFVLVAAGIAILLLCASMMFISGSVQQFIVRLQIGFNFGNLLNAGHTISEVLRIDVFSLSKKSWVAMIAMMVTMIIAIGRIKIKKGNVFLVIIAVAVFAMVALLTGGMIRKIPDFGKFRELLILGVVCSAIATTFLFKQVNVWRRISTAQWSIAILLLLMPRIASFGTNGNYWHQDGASAIFWLLSALTLIGGVVKMRADWSFAMPFVLVTQVLTAILLHSGMQKAYRQPSVWLNTSRLPDVPKVSSLVLFESYANYIKEASSTLQNHGFSAGDPLIDLSGQSPGLLYAVGAENAGYPWIFGGYPGSRDVAREILVRTSCEKIAAAWLLREPNGPRSIPDDESLMADFGVNISKDYIHVASWSAPEGIDGYEGPRRQDLYKPMAVDRMVQACLAKR